MNRETAEWLPLSEIPDGAVFETKDGVRAMKTEYRSDDGACQCYSLASGECAHFAQGIVDQREQVRSHNATLVRPCAVLSSCQPVQGDAGTVATLRECIAELERFAVNALSRPKEFFEIDSVVCRLRRDLYAARR